jgi:hypothetical protein
MGNLSRIIMTLPFFPPPEFLKEFSPIFDVKLSEGSLWL